AKATEKEKPHQAEIPAVFSLLRVSSLIRKRDAGLGVESFIFSGYPILRKRVELPSCSFRFWGNVIVRIRRVNLLALRLQWFESISARASPKPFFKCLGSFGGQLGISSPVSDLA